MDDDIVEGNPLDGLIEEFFLVDDGDEDDVVGDDVSADEAEDTQPSNFDTSLPTVYPHIKN